MSSRLAVPPEEAASRPSLDDVRADIDRIDGELLRLIEQRLDCALLVASLKEQSGDQKQLHLRPDREQQVIDRLSADARLLKPHAIADIWRAVMAVSLQAQQSIDLAIHAERRAVLVTDSARRRFGNAARLEAAATPGQALARARTRDAIAIIELHPMSDWWTFREDHRGLVLFETLRDERGGIVALAIGRVPRAHLPPTDDILMVRTSAELRERAEAGEPIHCLAMHGDERLCLLEGSAR